MKSQWCICINNDDTKWLKKGEKYLIRFWGKYAYIIRDEFNSHRRYSKVLANRFKTIKPIITFKPLLQ